MSSGYSFKNSHTLYQCEYSSSFKNIYVDVENCDVSSGYGYMNIHTDSQHNGLESLMNDKDIIDTDMNENLKNGDETS